MSDTEDSLRPGSDAEASKTRRPGPELRSQLWDQIVERDWPAQVISVRRDLDRIWARLEISAWHAEVEGPISEASAKTDVALEEGDWISLKLYPRWTPNEKAKSPPAHDVRKLDKGDFDALAARELERLKGARDLVVEFAGLEEERAELDAYRAELEEQWEMARNDQAAAVEAQLAAEQAVEASKHEQELAEAKQRAAEDLVELQQEERQELDRRTLEFEASGGALLAEALGLGPTRGPERLEVSELDSRSLSSEMVPSILEQLAAAGQQVPKVEVERALLFMLTAAVTGDLVLLGGPPGSGKSTLLTQLSRCLAARVTVVPARPAWLDPADLLGFFDHRLGIYRPTGFVDAVIDAQERSSELSVIVIDEVNIARIENYAADLLSQLERSKEHSGEGSLDLYPEWERSTAMAEFAEAGEDTDRTLTERARTLAKYPPRLVIPSNLVVAGTLNNDESTYELSPKVRDRSLVHIVEPVLPERVPASSARQVEVVWPVNPQELVEVASSPAVGIDGTADELWASLAEVFPQLLQLGVAPTHRFLRTLRVALRLGDRIGSQPPEILDALLLGKVLSGVVVLRNDQQKRDDLAELGSELSQRGLSTSALALERVNETLDRLPIAKVL